MPEIDFRHIRVCRDAAQLDLTACRLPADSRSSPAGPKFCFALSLY
jgi:hypothetical protein